MLKDSDKVTIFRKSKTYDATVLGSDGELFWLLVPDFKEVQRGDLKNVFVHQGMKCLKASEWNHKIADMFDADGQLNPGVFSNSPTPPEHAIKRLKAWKLLCPDLFIKQS